MPKKTQPTLSVEDKRWQQESDARTLADAKVIMSDPNRLKGAATAAKRMASEKMTEAKAMQNIAKKVPKSNGKGKKK